MALSDKKYKEFSSKLEKFCLDLGMTVFVWDCSKYFCYDENNPIWGTEFCDCPSGIVAFNDNDKMIWIYPEFTECRGDKILLDGDRQLSDNSNIYHYKKVIKKTIQKYKKFLILKKIDKINKDFQ